MDNHVKHSLDIITEAQVFSVLCCDISNKVFSATTARFSSLTEKEKGNFSAVSYFNGSFHSEYTALVLMDFLIYFRLESKWVGVLAYCYLFCFFNLVILIHFYTKTIF